MYGQLIFYKVPRPSNEKRSLYNKWCWDNAIPICKIMKLAPYLTPCVKIHSKLIKGLNLRVEARDLPLCFLRNDTTYQQKIDKLDSSILKT